MRRQIRRDDLTKEFQRIASGSDAMVSQNPFGGYAPCGHESNDNSYFLSEDQLKDCCGIDRR